MSSATVTVYRQRRAIGDLFTVAYSMDGRRTRRAYSGEQEALRAAEQAAVRIAKGDRDAMKVSDIDWRLYALATDARRETGTLIDVLP